MVNSLRESYQAYLLTLMGDRTFVLKVFIRQFSNTSVQAGAADMNLVIGNARYELCRDDENFIMIGTQYARPYVDKDHLSNHGYRTDGEGLGNAVAEYLNTGKEPGTPAGKYHLVRCRSHHSIAGRGREGSDITNPGPKTDSRGCIHDSTSETSRISNLFTTSCWPLFTRSKGKVWSEQPK